ncbi:MAG TPA: PDZ domain-containing protein, partial [Desulfobacterales bacterium]|nr:PDZ domain-containing protein [Desulfobacterales bacterium]
EIPLQPGDFAWIISYEDLSDQKVYLGVIIRDTEHGVKVLGTMKNSTAQKAGVQKNDIITALDGEPIATKLDLTYVVGLKRPREKGVLEVLRDGKPLRFELIFQAARNLRTSP